jgi:hypothetical protein
MIKVHVLQVSAKLPKEMACYGATWLLAALRASTGRV